MTAPEGRHAALRHLLVELTGLRIGAWKVRRSCGLYLLVAERVRKFVFVVEEADPSQSPARLKKKIARAVGRMLDVRSPFEAGSGEGGAGRVVAFEVAWGDVQGMDYDNPLLVDGRIVLEAAMVARREFESMSHFQQFYSEMMYSAGWLLHQPIPKPGLQGDGALHALSESRSVPEMNLKAFVSPSGKSQDDRGRLEATTNVQNSLGARGQTVVDGSDESSECSDCSDWSSKTSQKAVTVYDYRTLTCHFSHSAMSSRLRPCVESDVRLLKLLEGGVPTWAVFLPACGFWYRPWMRTVTWLVFIAVSTISLACGFYDLYMNVPFLKSAVLRLIDAINLPAVDILEWLEVHVQVRLSILLTFLYGKSPLFVATLRVCGNAWKVISNFLRPIALSISNFLRHVATSGWQLLSPLVFGLKTFATSLLTCISWVLQSLLAMVQQPLAVLAYGAQCMAAAIEPLLSLVFVPWRLSMTMFLHLQKSCLSMFRVGRDVATTASAISASSQPGVAWTWEGVWASWLAIPADILALFRTSALKVAKAVRSVANVLFHILQNANQHRISLGLWLRHLWMVTRAWMVNWLVFLSFGWLSGKEDAAYRNARRQEVLRPLEVTEHAAEINCVQEGHKKLE
ncbi:unnamed protein product [Ostreobium quekettii]|uniref:Transmembrane protein n=1 Tax=Ostreobium quekettii TaxID=121088 RepID=A0A8S1JF43_9CHLO|nr:unnamed protein product [Ostreobium quekettii]|eukprot:evm.model.scf_3346.1 EVM.evm.TU.scf_3346.1   scf_3346:2649-8819(+)